MACTRLLIVDSHELMRAGLRTVLAPDPELKIVAEAASGHHAVALAREHRPHVVLIEARLPDEDGADTCRLLNALSPRPALGILTDQADDASVRACVRAGAQGYLLKQVSGEDLGRAGDAPRLDLGRTRRRAGKMPPPGGGPTRAPRP